jgi:hypothetical protein
MENYNINSFIMSKERDPIIIIFFSASNKIFNNIDNIVECVRFLNTKEIERYDSKNIIKSYYLGCSGLRKENYDITNASLCLWILAQEILNFNLIHKTKLDKCLEKEQMKITEIKNFYLKTIAKTTSDFRKIENNLK